MNEGLTSDEFKQLEQLFIKANDEQLKLLEDHLIAHQNKRNKKNDKKENK